MAFTVTTDHARQEQAWDAIQKSWSKDPHQIRRMLTERAVRASDRRAVFIGLDAYEAAGGVVTRDLFAEDDGGWLETVGLLDRGVLSVGRKADLNLIDYDQLRLATPEVLYRAFTDPAALAAWLAPGDMTGEVHRFDYRVGGGYQMSLYYPSSEQTLRGKTQDREDRYTARFVELTPARRIVEAIALYGIVCPAIFMV